MLVAVTANAVAMQGTSSAGTFAFRENLDYGGSQAEVLEPAHVNDLEHCSCGKHFGYRSNRYSRLIIKAVRFRKRPEGPVQHLTPAKPPNFRAYI